jgi:hypothetical protein
MTISNPMPVNPLTSAVGQTTLSADLCRAAQFRLSSGSAWLAEIDELEQLCKQCDVVDTDVIAEVS